MRNFGENTFTKEEQEKIEDLLFKGLCEMKDLYCKHGIPESVIASFFIILGSKHFYENEKKYFTLYGLKVSDMILDLIQQGKKGSMK